MSKDKFNEMLVNAIIGDIPVAFSADDFDDTEFDDITDEEIAEFDAMMDESGPHPALTDEQIKEMTTRGMKIVRWILYAQAMQKRGLSHLDRHEYMNMQIEPTVPGDEG